MVGPGKVQETYTISGTAEAEAHSFQEKIFFSRYVTLYNFCLSWAFGDGWKLFPTTMVVSY